MRKITTGNSNLERSRHRQISALRYSASIGNRSIAKNECLRFIKHLSHHCSSHFLRALVSSKEVLLRTAFLPPDSRHSSRSGIAFSLTKNMRWQKSLQNSKHVGLICRWWGRKMFHLALSPPWVTISAFEKCFFRGTWINREADTNDGVTHESWVNLL